MFEPPAGEWLFGPDDGLLAVPDRVHLTIPMNLRRPLDRYAPESPGLSMVVEDRGGAVIDTYFGNAWSGMPQDGAEVYGRAETLRHARLDALADSRLGFLRVPFKRIPRMSARSLGELREIVDTVAGVYGSGRLLYRGQNREYLLERSPAFCQRFYGEDHVAEPSLTPSGSRRSPSVEDCMPELMMWLQLWQELSLQEVARHYPRKNELEEQVFDHFCGEVEELWGQPRFYFQALALAQHYGLASVGLDVSDRLEVALFFALRRFARSDADYAAYVPLPADAKPVLYILLREGTREFPFAQSVATILRSGRPANQSAWFLHVGWGLARDAAAEQIVAAVYLDPSCDYGPIPSAQDLFPPPETDRLGAFLSSARHDVASSTLAAVLADFYWIR